MATYKKGKRQDPGKITWEGVTTLEPMGQHLTSFASTYSELYYSIFKQYKCHFTV